MKNIKSIILLVGFISAVTLNSSMAQNKSLLFNGTSNKVVIPNHADLNFTTQFTLEAWIYANVWKNQTWQGSVINKDAEIGGVSEGYMIRIGGGGRLEGIVTPGWAGTATGPVMKEKSWNHVAMVFKEGEMWLYVNGALEAYKNGLPVSINKSAVDLQIGDSPGFPGRVWDGKIDEVRFWNIARTATDIQQNMGVVFEGTEDGLVAYYNFDENSTSNILTDKTSNGHNGTLINYDSTYPWVEGYELNQNDLSLMRIINPGNSPVWSNSERIQLEIKNIAINSVSNFDVAFEYEGEVYSENVTHTIEPGQTYVHAFYKFIDLESQNEAKIKAYISWDSDTDPTNNMLEEIFVRTNTIRLMDRVPHNFGENGQSQSRNITLPDVNSEFSTILLHVSVDCPPSGCDPWDQMGNVKIKKDGKEYEIGRFITPYKKACGPWTIDVSDFRSVLTGNIDIMTFIQVWGASGWLLTLDLEYVKGDLDKPFTQIVPLYELDRQVYGDPSISYNLAEQNVAIPANCQLAHIRMTNTGHGQANTNNAAEFMVATHHIWVNGVEQFTHHLWKEDCNQNVCSPQSGTWQYARAGWCPGQQVNPAWFNIVDVLTPGETMSFDYVLQDYTNFLNTGYNGGSHTEPFYKIYSYLFLASDSPFENYSDLAIDEVRILEGNEAGGEVISIKLTNKGSLNIINAEIGYVINNSEAIVKTTTLNLDAGAGSTVEIDVPDLDITKPGILVAFADSENDQIVSNNSKAVHFGNYTSITNNLVQHKVKVYPNPAKDVITVVSLERSPVSVEIFDSMGRRVYQNEFTDRIQISTNKIPGSGMFLVKVTTETQTFLEKLVIE